MLIGSCQQFVGSNLIVLVEQYGAILGIVDVGTHLIHAIGRLNCNYVVDTRFAETAIGQVDGLVATIAKKNILGWYALNLAEACLELQLQWVGVAVEWLIVWRQLRNNNYEVTTRINS